MTIKDWQGVANDAATIPERVVARVGIDLPEDVERDIAAQFGEAMMIKNIWRMGMVDIIARGEQVHLRMSAHQADVWKKVRDS